VGVAVTIVVLAVWLAGAMTAKQAAALQFARTVPPEAPVGIHGVRVYSPRGVSNLKLFCVDDLPNVAEAAGNGSLKTPQELTIPCAVDGLVDNLTRDFFKFKAEKGQLITLEVHLPENDEELARRLDGWRDPRNLRARLGV